MNELIKLISLVIKGIPKIEQRENVEEIVQKLGTALEVDIKKNSSI